ncbi:TadE/TadG family type IV pilus assembly protein [Marilutibacter chinensis]|uniref:Tad domain-containing protein n=1 Tax=Marilutibacter chinensis TaxID=2912247 RepID=A0ABS9HXJ0_9GAMM|nr:Tad domain-containing protein [Lysobacter chinensis]MCF7223604.1 Tad domain-containing protein [Lysobacter chinensis]
MQLSTPNLRARMRNARRPGGRNNVRGQALVLFVVLVSILCLGLILVFDTGQSVNKKVQLVNSADAAAYSVAVQQARTLNFAAYMNRGRVANEVAIAQLVSIWSWTNYLHAHTALFIEALDWLKYIPYVGSVFAAMQAVYKAGEVVVGGIRTAYRPVASTAIQALDGLNGLLAGAARTFVRWGGIEAAQIAKDVLKENDPTAEIDATGWVVLGQQLTQAASDGPNSFLQKHDLPGRNRRTAGMDRYRNVVMESRDRFSADRSQRNSLLIIKLPANGGTDMVDYNRWAAVDTLQLKINLPWPLDDISVPMGWGGAQAVENMQPRPKFFPGIRAGGRNGRGNGWRAYYHNRQPTYAQYSGATNWVAKQLAANQPSVNLSKPFPYRNITQRTYTKRDDAYFTGYQGLRDYDDVRRGFAENPDADNDKAGPIFSVYVSSDRRNARTSQDIDGIGAPAGGKLELRSNASKLTAISTAQVYFNRAPYSALFRRMVPRSWNGRPSSDDQLEMGNLFSPYWQARLIETPNSVYTKVGIGSLVTGP